MVRWSGGDGAVEVGPRHLGHRLVGQPEALQHDDRLAGSTSTASLMSDSTVAPVALGDEQRPPLGRRPRRRSGGRRRGARRRPAGRCRARPRPGRGRTGPARPSARRRRRGRRRGAARPCARPPAASRARRRAPRRAASAAATSGVDDRGVDVVERAGAASYTSSKVVAPATSGGRRVALRAQEAVRDPFDGVGRGRRHQVGPGRTEADDDDPAHRLSRQPSSRRRRWCRWSPSWPACASPSRAGRIRCARRRPTCRSAG